MKVGETNAVQMSFFTSMLEVVKAAFGGGKDGKKPITNDMSKLSAEEFASQLNAMGRRKD